MRPFALTALATTALGRALPQQQDTEGDCSANPSGSGPVPKPDTPEAFRDYDAFSQAAVSAQTPSGYVLSYKNQTVTYNNPQLFAGYKLLDSYDVGACKFKTFHLIRCICICIIIVYRIPINTIAWNLD